MGLGQAEQHCTLCVLCTCLQLVVLNPIQARGGGEGVGKHPLSDVDTLLDQLGSKLNADTFCKFLNIPIDQFRTIK